MEELSFESGMKLTKRGGGGVVEEEEEESHFVDEEINLCCKFTLRMIIFPKLFSGKSPVVKENFVGGVVFVVS